MTGEGSTGRGKAGCGVLKNADGRVVRGLDGGSLVKSSLRLGNPSLARNDGIIT
jgi:hypothetical protein